MGAGQQEYLGRQLRLGQLSDAHSLAIVHYDDLLVGGIVSVYFEFSHPGQLWSDSWTKTSQSMQKSLRHRGHR